MTLDRIVVTAVGVALTLFAGWFFFSKESSRP
jgi:hypothetical protein